MDRAVRRKFWLWHIDSWRASGLSQSAYCREHELALASFNYWKRRVDRPDRADDSGAVVAALVAVDLPPPVVGGQMRLRWEGGLTVELGIGFSHSTLCEVFRAVKDVHANG